MDAAAWKAKGNEAFSNKDFDTAIECFSKSIEQDQNNHVLYSNRSACYASVHGYTAALADAKKCVELNPHWTKGYIRLGAAYHGLRKYDLAIEAYNSGLKIDPSNATLQQGLNDLENARGMMNPLVKIFTKDCIPKIQQNPRIAMYMMMPDFVQTLSKIIDDPSIISEYMKDQRVLHVAMELSGIQVPIKTSEDEDDDNFSRRGGARTTAATAKKRREEQDEEAKAKAASAINSDALKLKEQGNELYKQRKFEDALHLYEQAFEIDPQTTFLLNKTAVLFEQGEFEKCIEECEKAIEHGNETKCDYQLIAKLMTRKAFCLQKLTKYDEAIILYKKALVEWRNSDTLNKLNACEKEKKKAAEDAYINPEIALEQKTEGNNFFKQDQFPQAVECYTEAIKRNPTEHTAYSNRAATYLKLGAYSEALIDAEKCISLKPDFVKAYVRKGNAQFWLKEFYKALQSFEDGLKLDPQNTECREGKMRTMMRIQQMATSQGDEDAARRAMADPEIQAIVNDSYMQLILSEMQKDPNRITEYLKDPGIAAKINKLIQAGILRVDNRPAEEEPMGRNVRRGGGAMSGRRW